MFRGISMRRGTGHINCVLIRAERRLMARVYCANPQSWEGVLTITGGKELQRVQGGSRGEVIDRMSEIMRTYPEAEERV